MLPKKKVVRKNQNDANDKINMTNVDRNCIVGIIFYSLKECSGETLNISEETQI